ncbi:MAG: thioredoxin family protein, partial [Pseudonocardiaceae bacterium]
HMASIADAHPDLTVVKLDASKARRLCMSLQVRGLPTILLLRDGQEMARICDPNLVADQVDTWLANALAELPTKEA